MYSWRLIITEIVRGKLRISRAIGSKRELLRGSNGDGGAVAFLPLADRSCLMS